MTKLNSFFSICNCKILTIFLGTQVVNTVNSSNETPLHVACMLNNAKGVQVLQIYS